MSTFSTIIDELKTEALNFWEAVKSEAASTFSGLENKAEEVAAALKPVVEADLAKLLSDLKTVAINTVGELATAEFNTLTGAQKNTITANTIVQAAVAQGKQIAITDAQALAQHAFNALAATKPAS